MKKLQFVGLFVSLFILSISFAANAQTRYVTDVFKIMVRTGPTGKNKILETLESGASVQVLEVDPDNGHTKVKTAKGNVGYVLTRFLLEKPVARSRVKYLEGQLQQLRSKPGELQTLLASSQEENQELIAQNLTLTNQYKLSSQELERIKEVSADAVNLSERSAKLESEVQKLLLQLDDIRIQNEVLKDQSAKKWYVLGGGTVLIGLLLGWILSIARRPRRQSWGA